MNLSAKTWLILLMLLLCLGLLYGNSFGERTATSLKAKGIQPWLIVILISMLPLIELRGAIPVAMAIFGMPWYEAVFLSVIGNMLPIPFILLFVDWGFRQLRRFSLGARFTDWLYQRTANKGKMMQRYEELGLIIFVGIPLPGTGAWTGALAAKIFALSFWKSMLCIFLGVLLAAALVTTLTVLGLLAVG